MIYQDQYLHNVIQCGTQSMTVNEHRYVFDYPKISGYVGIRIKESDTSCKRIVLCTEVLILYYVLKYLYFGDFSPGCGEPDYWGPVKKGLTVPQ